MPKPSLIEHIGTGAFTTLLVDGNNCMHRNGHVFHGLTAPDKRPSGALYGCVSEIRKLTAHHKFRDIVFVIDAGIPQFRMDLVQKHAEKGNGYKAKRSEKRNPVQEKIYKAVKAQLDYCHEVFESVGITVARAQGFEADDLIGSIVQSLPETKFLVCSNDKDMLQLARLKNCNVWSPSTNQIVEKPEKSYLLKRAMIGDSSDNIPGIRGIGKETANKIIEELGFEGRRPDELLAVLDPNITSHKKILDNAKRLKDYYKATSLRETRDCHKSATVITGKYDSSAMKKMCIKYGFKQFREQFDTMVRQFGKVAERKRTVSGQ